MLFWSRSDEKPLTGCTVDAGGQEPEIREGIRSDRATDGVEGLAREPLQTSRTLASLAVSKIAGLADDVTVLMKLCSQANRRYKHKI